MIIASIDNSKLELNIKELGRSIEEGVPRGLLDAGNELMRLSQLEVPHDEGTLQNSGTVETDNLGINGMKSVIVGYHTPYAARLHEHPEYHFREGRKGKYLEDPARKNTEALGIKVFNVMRRIVSDGTS